MVRARSYRLLPWLVRALIPPRRVGTYVLSNGGGPTYVGRSDNDLRERLLNHAATQKARYFTYQVYPTPEKAFIAECAAYHALKGSVTNLIHPAVPSGNKVRCPFCKEIFDRTRDARIAAPPNEGTTSRKVPDGASRLASLEPFPGQGLGSENMLEAEG